MHQGGRIKSSDFQERERERDYLLVLSFQNVPEFSKRSPTPAPSPAPPPSTTPLSLLLLLLLVLLVPDDDVFYLFFQKHKLAYSHIPLGVLSSIIEYEQILLFLLLLLSTTDKR
jgi:hypothetical protein